MFYKIVIITATVTHLDLKIEQSKIKAKYFV